MKKSIQLLLFTILLFCNVSVFGQNTNPNESTASGLLYKITGKELNKPSYLYGTIHIICPNDLFGMEKLETYFNETDRLILEIDMDDPEVLKSMASALDMPKGKTLQDLLTPEKYEKVDEMFKKIYGIPVSVLSKFGPMGLSIAISTSPKSLGCPVPASYESKFAGLASKAQKPIEGLETVEDQVSALSKTPIEKQAEDLYKLSLDPDKAINQFKELMAAYKLQDSEKLVEFIVKHSAESPELQTNLLDERNKKWIPKIEKAIAEKPTFFAVGGGHLGGHNGVVNLLRKQGYTVSAIKF